VTPGDALLQAAVDYSQAVDLWNATTTNWESSSAYTEVQRAKDRLANAALLYARPRV
jgi:hypothetical protein